MSKRRPLPLLSRRRASPAETARVLQERGRLLKWLGTAGAVALLPTPSPACALIPSETEGPYPGDGTNGPNVLIQNAIVRTDIRPSFGASGHRRRFGYADERHAATGQHHGELRTASGRRRLPLAA